MSSYITQQGSILYFRLRVPSDIRNHLKQGEIKLSLRTGYRSQAKGRAMVMAGICLQVFEALRQGYEVSRRQFMQRLKESVEQACELALVQSDPRALVRSSSTPSSYKSSHTNGCSLIGVSTQVQPLASMMPVQTASTHVPLQASNTNGSKADEASTQPVITLEDTVKEYLEESRPNWAKRTHEKIAPHLYEFLDLTEGRELAPEQLSLEHARQYKKYTPLIPRNQTKMKLYRNKPLLKVVRGKVAEEHKISAGSVGYRFTVVKSYLKWLRVNYGIRDDFRDVLKVKRTKLSSTSSRNPFSDADLKALFDTRHFRKGEDGFDRPWKYWVPLIGLYSGMRLTEICQLYLEDIKQVEGIWCFDVNANTEDKSVKTEAGKRLVPIHSKLIELGLIERVKALTHHAHTRLFPDLPYGCHGYSDPVSKWFSRYKQVRGIKSSNKVFHSFRNTLSTRFKREGVHLGIAAQIMGHTLEKQSMTFDYYADGYTVEQMKEAIEVVSFGM